MHSRRRAVFTVAGVGLALITVGAVSSPAALAATRTTRGLIGRDSSGLPVWGLGSSLSINRSGRGITVTSPITITKPTVPPVSTPSPPTATTPPIASPVATTTPTTVAATQPGNNVTTTADAFIESVGVNVHTYYSNTSYANLDQVITLLKSLGVRHVRDVLVDDRPDEVAALQALGQAGIRSELVLPGTGFGSTLAVDPDQISELQSLAPFVDAVEPPNEYDCSGDVTWAADLHRYVSALTQTLQTTPGLSSLGVLAPSFCEPSSVTTYGSVAGTASADNFHDYAAGAAPEASLEGRLPKFAQLQDPNLPSIVTETGYSNATNSGSTSVLPSTAADYSVRTLLDDARLGISRTYLYELLDEQLDASLAEYEEHFGLANDDGSPKPAFTAVQNLLADIAQGSPSTVTAASESQAPYPVTLSGGGSLLRSLTISDPNGTGETVALWLATPLENTSTHTALQSPVVPVQVGTSTLVGASSQQPSGSNVATSLGSGTSFSVPVSGQVTLVHLAASTDDLSATCTAQQSYDQTASAYGALATGTLDASTAGWTGSPQSASGLPAALSSAAEITADNQQVHVDVPGSPSTWTIALWERTAATSASYATFLHATGATGELMRTYDVTDDVPTHYQLSGYGAPTSASPAPTEMLGVAVPTTWHLLTLTDDGSTTTLSIDGMAVGSAASSAAPLTGIDVGALTSGFRGAVGGLTVFPQALSAAQQLTLATTASVSC